MAPLSKNGKLPNVIVFFTDQQRWDTTGLHGNPLDLTPNFDRMAQQGTHIFSSFTTQPVCGPARASLQTGLYPTTTGVWRNAIALPENKKTLAHYFKEGGYQTAYIGKWHLAKDNSETGGPVPEEERGGYEYWLASNILEFTSQPYHTVMFDNDNKPVFLPGYRVDALTDAAIKYISGHRQRPFYLFLSYLEPHHQNNSDDYPAPEGYRERYEGRWIPSDLAALGGAATYQNIAGYFGMVKRLDEALGRMLDALKSLQMLDNTIILFTSDHGNHFKTRNTEYKRSCHDSSIRVPTALQGPGFNGGGRVTQLVSHIDLAPTLLAAAGLPVPSVMPGRPITPLKREQMENWPEEVFVQISEAQVGRAIRTNRWKFSMVAPGKDGWEVPASDLYQEEFLYDLVADPYELTNLAGMEAYAGVVEDLKKRITRRMAEAGEDIPVIENAPTRPHGQRHVAELGR
ncbi:MAG TPA: sulfatase-like hydrolase/transferase [Chloroflexia bacterium]|nr:sulfatase-like hydrolase/transferase [Chloroflexia bacterium]